MEVDGGVEERGVLEEGRKFEEGDGATVMIGHDALDRAVVSDSGIAELQGLGHQLGTCC